MNKQIIILIGLKGSGKTYIGSLLQKKLGIHFFRVEDIWLSLKSERLSNEYIIEGFNLVKQKIDSLLLRKNRIIIESTGVTEYFPKFLDSLSTQYEVKLVKIVTSPEVCLHRVKSRDLSIHVPVSDDIVSEINQIASKVDLKYDLIIDNERTSDSMIIEMFQKMIK